MTQLLIEIDYEYESNNRAANAYFNMYIETGEENYKEKELMSVGAASQCLRLKELINFNSQSKNY